MNQQHLHYVARLLFQYFQKYILKTQQRPDLLPLWLSFRVGTYFEVHTFFFLTYVWV